jgi:uncharacterized repeat protein (TIGR01451 family)
VRCRRLYLAVVLLAAVLSGWQGRAAAQNAAPPAGNGLGVIATTRRKPAAQPVIAPPNTSVPQPFLAPTGPVLPAGPPPAPLPTPTGAPALLRVRAESPQGGERPGAGTPPQFAPAPPVRADTEPPPLAGALAGQPAPLSLEKIGPASHKWGKPFKYTIVVRNPAPTPVFQVRLQEELPAGASCLTTEPKAAQDGQRLVWEIDSVEAGGQRQFKVEVQPAGEGEFQSSATVTFSLSGHMRTKITRSRLGLTMSGPERAVVGDAVAFELQVTNPGSGPATNVVLHVTLPDGLKHEAGSSIAADVGTLAPGASKSITLKTTAASEGRMAAEAVANADDDLQADARAVVQVATATLLLRKTGTQQSLIGRELEHRLEVVNPCPVPVTGAQLIDTLPEGLEHVSASDGGVYDAAARSVAWSLGTLGPGETRTVTIRLLARKPGDWVNQAVVRADRGIEAKSGVPVHVEGVPALLLEVVDLDDPVEVKGETTYEIRVVNQGSGTCTNVQMRGVIPAGLEALSADGPTAYRLQERQVIFEPLPKLAAKADALYRIRVRALKPGDWHFKAVLSCDQFQRPVNEEESTQVYDDEPDAPGKPPAAPPSPMPGPVEPH